MTVTYRYEHTVTTGSGDDKTKVSKTIIDGSEGLSIKYFHKCPKKFHMLMIKESEPGKFSVTEKKDDKEDKKEIDTKGLNDIIKKLKLAFISDYMKIRKKQLKGGSLISNMISSTKAAKKSSKTSSKKAPKKALKKAPKK